MGMTAAQLEALMTQQFGPDFRNKAIIGPVGSLALRDVFEEAGLEDPKAPRDSGCYGLWQICSRA